MNLDSKADLTYWALQSTLLDFQGRLIFSIIYLQNENYVCASGKYTESDIFS